MVQLFSLGRGRLPKLQQTHQALEVGLVVSTPIHGEAEALVVDWVGSSMGWHNPMLCSRVDDTQLIAFSSSLSCERFPFVLYSAT